MVVVRFSGVVLAHSEADEESDTEDEGGKRNDEAVFGTGSEIALEGTLTAIGSVCTQRHVEGVDDGWY